MGLQMLCIRGVKHVKIVGGSQLVIKQLASKHKYVSAN